MIADCGILTGDAQGEQGKEAADKEAQAEKEKEDL